MSIIITLTTDFGTSDSYVAQMKGIILSLAPEASLIDITHEIPPCDIQTAARILKESVPLYPEGSIHVAVVDPGVGSRRKRLIIEAQVEAEFEHAPKRVFLIGPDNGLFSAVAPERARKRIWEINKLAGVPKFRTGETFDGRNIFAPVAAQLAAGKGPDEFGTEIESAAARMVETDALSQPISMDGIIKGQIVYFDHFGNAATNISRSQLGAGKVIVSLPRRSVTLELRQHFEQFEANAPGCIINSQGFLEIVANRASVKELLGLKLGDIAQVTFG